MRSVEVTAKKVQDAINQGLEQLGVRLDEVTVEVIEQGGLFRKAKVKLTVDADEEAEKDAPAEKKAEKKDAPAPEADRPKKAEKAEKAEAPAQKPTDKPAQKSADKPADKPKKTEKAEKPADKPAQKSERAQKQKPEKSDKPQDGADDKKPTREERAAAHAHAVEFIKGCIERMGFEAVDYSVGDDGVISITAPAGDDSLIIGRHGETLSALAYLAETGARAEKSRVNITVDCNGYRERRQASLASMARRKADECVRRHRKIKLEPMERADRRTVHFALNDDNRVITSSEGKEPYRCVVIIPKSRDRRESVPREDIKESDASTDEE